MELGPRWTTLELRAVFTLLRHSAAAASDSTGAVWADLAAQIPTRTPAMLRALFELQHAYLAQPDATVSGFFAAMASYYGSLGASASSANGAGSAASAEQDVVMEDAERAAGHATAGHINADATRDTNTIATHAPRCNSTSSVRPASQQRVVSHVSTAPPAAAVRTAQTPEKRHRVVDAHARRAADDAQLDRRAQHQLQIQPAGSGHKTDASEASRARTSSSRKAASPRRARAFTADLSSLGREPSSTQQQQQQQFALPWTHWFCPSTDRAFFCENEFVDCLQRMGLANMTRAARPVWSSVRASMGRPRRLSKRFFAHEKSKLERARAAARTCSLAPGTTVLAPLGGYPVAFTVGTVLSCDVRTGACTIELAHDLSVCVHSIDAVMALEHKSGAQTCGSASRMQLSLQQALPSVLQCAGRSLPVLPAAPRSEPTQQQQREAMSSALLTVKDLLQRKEQVVIALAALNARAARGRVNGAAMSLEATTASSRAGSVEGHLTVDAKSSDDWQLLERQCAWLVQNLDATNRSLQLALVALQQCTQDASASVSEQADAAAAHTPVAVPVSVSPVDAHGATESLSLEHMKWAVQFLAQSRSSAGDLVAKSVAHMNEHSHQEQHQALAPETRELIATSLCLMSVVRRGIASESPRVPPLVTQKLTERLLELLEPHHAANVDLYTELRAAANSVLATLRP